MAAIYPPGWSWPDTICAFIFYLIAGILGVVGANKQQSSGIANAYIVLSSIGLCVTIGQQHESMDNISNMDLKKAVLDVLPSISLESVSAVVAKLLDTGVENVGDLSFVTYEDLDQLLKPIQIRKLISSWKDAALATEVAIAMPSTSIQHVTATARTEMGSPVIASASGRSPHSSPACANLDANWAYRYEIPWSKMPKRGLMNVLNTGGRPRKADRFEFISILMKDIMGKKQKPGKKALEIIARNVINRYPASFSDDIEGVIIGTGHSSLVRQLVSKNENERREKDANQKKTTVVAEASDPETPAKKAKLDTYGCISFVPDLPEDESVESLTVKKNELKCLFVANKKMSDVEVAALMSQTYYLQRSDVLEGNNLETLSEEWPFLFESRGLFTNFEALTGINIRERLEMCGNRFDKIVAWAAMQKKREIMQIDMDLNRAKRDNENDAAEVPAAILTAMAFFAENPDNMFILFEEAASVGDVEQSGLPETPCVVVCGESILTAKRFMLSIDGKVMNDHIRVFLTAVAMMFAAYFCCNIQYPVDLAATLDFIQRCLVGINPEKGSKVEYKKSKRQYVENPRVLTFIRTLAEYEWTQ